MLSTLATPVVLLTLLVVQMDKDRTQPASEAPPTVQGGSDERSPRADAMSGCERYSLEGIRLGMTADEAQRAIPGAKVQSSPLPSWNKAERKSHKGQSYRLFKKGTEKGKPDQVEVFIALDDSGRVEEVARSYVVLTGVMNLNLERQVSVGELMAACRSRFGEPAWESGEPVATNRSNLLAGSTRTEMSSSRWESSECGAAVIVEHGETYTSESATPLLYARLERFGGESGGSSKIKF